MMAKPTTQNKLTTEAAERRPDPIDVHVGQRLRQRRMLIGLSQEKLGESVGLTFQQIQKYERGANRMGASRVFRFAQVLAVPVTYFFEEMAGANTSATRQKGIAENRQVGLAEDELPQDDLLQRRETLDLVRAFYRIEDQKQRRKILELIKAIATAEAAAEK